MNVWGQHLILDLGKCNSNVLDALMIEEFVKELVIAIDMKAYGDPQIVHFAEHSEEAAGFSLVQLIETSAIMGHFSDKTQDAYLDIFSCKYFDVNDVLAVVNHFFSPAKIKMRNVARGTDLTGFPILNEGVLV